MTSVTTANFFISGWGTGATFSVIGWQERCSITIHAGTTPSISPTITYTYPNGAYPLPPLLRGQMTSGTGVVAPIQVVASTTQAVVTYESLPAATKTYIFQLDCLGI